MGAAGTACEVAVHPFTALQKPPMSKCCRGLNCTSTALIKAHIIPRGFARLARESGKTIAIKADRRPAVAKNQLGVFDSSILCEACDNELGRFDDYAIEFCGTFLKRRKPYSNLGFQVFDVDTDLLRKAILAILWRSSISALPACEGVSLGSYEQKARDVLFGAIPLNQFPEFQIVVQQYIVSFARSAGFYTLPHRTKFAGLNTYLFGLVGLRFLVKMDARLFPPIMREWVIGDSPRIIGTKVHFDEASEGRALLDAVKKFGSYRR